MLYLDDPIRIGGLDVFRDYNYPRKFHFLPRSPRVATEGNEALFHLLIWRDENTEGEEEGGGFLTMTADLKVPEQVLEDARRELSRRYGVQAELTPLQVESGAVKVSMLDSSSGDEERGSFVEQIVAHGTPSLYGDQRAVFTAELSQRGAVAMQESLLNEGASPVMLVYELTYRGLLPAYECKIEIDFQQSYDYLRNRMTFASLFLQADLDTEMEELEKRGAIKIKEVVYHTDDPEQRQQRMQQLQQLARELAQWTFFKPGLNPGAVLAQNVRDLHAEGGVAAGLDVSTPFHRMMTGTGGGSEAPSRPATAATEASGERLSGAETQASESSATPDSGGTAQQSGGNPAVEAWNRAGRPQATYQLKQISQRERQHIVFELNQVSATTRTIAPQGQLRLLPGMADAGGRIQEIGLDSDFFKRIEGTVAVDADLDAFGVSSLNVELRYGRDEDGTGPADDDSFLLEAAGEEHAYGFFRDASETLDVDYRVTVNYQPDSAIGNSASHVSTDWIRTGDRHIEIDPRIAGGIVALDIQAASVDWNLVDQVQANVVYDDPAGEEMDGRTTVILKSDAQSQRVLVRPREPRDPIRVDASFRYKDGAEDTVSLSRVGSGPVIINQPADSTHTVDVTLLDPMARFRNVRVQFARGEDEDSLELSGDRSRASWSFRPEDDNRSYRYRVTYMLDGPVHETDWVDTETTQLLLGDKVDGMLRVEVMLLGSLADANMRALRLTLRYPDAPDWADAEFEQTIVAGSQPDGPIEWRVPMADRTRSEYEVEMQWFASDGSRQQTGPITTDQETVLIDPALPEEIL